MTALLARRESDEEKAALVKLRKARRLLLLKFIFYGHAAYHLTFRISRRYPIMATDGKFIEANPDWLLSTQLDIVAGVLAHEIAHVLLQHHLRRGSREHSSWNRACDFAINGALDANDVPLVPGMLIDHAYDNMSAEAIYASWQRAAEPPPPPPPPANQSAPDSGVEPGDADPSPSGSTSDDEDQTDDDHPAGHDSSPADDASPTAPADGAPAPSDTSPGPATPSTDWNASDPDTPGAGGPTPDDASASTGSSQPPAGEDSRGTGAAGQPGDATGAGPAARTPAPGSPIADADQNYGGCGCVLDAGTLGDGPLDAHQRNEEKGRWAIIARQSAALAKSHGQGTAGYVEIDTIIGSTGVRWQDILAAFMQRRRASEYSWSPPNRRFVDSGLYLPSLTDDRLDTVVLALDTSGSTLHARDRFATEFTAILETTRPQRVLVVYCHDLVSHVTEATEHDLPLTLERTVATGGTAFAPVFAWLEEHDIEPDCLVYLTDLIASEYCFGPQPPYPVLWATVGRTTAPWGEILPIDA